MKLKLLFTLLLASFFTLAQVPTNGLVKEYLFSGGSLSSTISNTLQNGTVDLTMVNSGTVTSVNDRLSNSNDAVSISGASLQSGSTLSNNVTSYSYSFWIKTNLSDNNLRTIVDQYQFGSNVTNRGFSLNILNGRLQIWSYFAYGNLSLTNFNAAYVGPTQIVADDNWHHIVVTVSSSSTFTTSGVNTNRTLSNTLKVYYDNVLVGTNTQTVNPSYTNLNFIYTLLDVNKNLAIGSLGGNDPNGSYQGIIDDFRYYETELSISDINLLNMENVVQTPLYVNVNATGANNGSSWNDAFTNLQTAIVNNPTNKEIWVAAGTYKHYLTDRASGIVFTNGTRIYGGFNGTEININQRDPKLNSTIISGDVLGNDNPSNTTILNSEASRQDNKYHVLAIKDGVQNVIIDGFTISGGNANGGVQTSGIDQYYRTRGGAVQVVIKTANEHVSATFRNCIFEKNSASDTGVFANYYYNGINNMSCDVKFENCVFRNNFGNTGSNILFVGAKAFNWNTSGKIVNCLFYENQSFNSSAAIYLFASTSGTGSTNLALDVDIIKSTFANNRGGTIAGGPNQVLRFDNASNCGFYNNILFGNAVNGNQSSIPTFYHPSPVTNLPEMFHNITEGYSSGTNVNVNPLFNADFTLQSSSPAINSGNNAYLSSLYATDLSGNNRFVGTVDKGAYEYDAALSNLDFNLSNDFIVYPNPVSETLYIQTEEKIKKITLYSLDGRKLIENYSNSIHVKELPSGIFLVTIETENGKINNQRIIKK